MPGGLLSRSQSVRWPGSDSRSPQTTSPNQLERERADSMRNMQRPMNVPSPATASGGTQLNLRRPSPHLQPPLQRRQSASSTNNNVVAERGVIERQISNRSVVDVQRRSTYPPANTNTTVPLSSTPRAPRRVSADGDGNGVSLLRRSHNSSSADSDMIRRRRMITEEEWNGAPHAHQKTTDDPNNLGRYKIAARRRRKINGLKRVK